MCSVFKLFKKTDLSNDELFDRVFKIVEKNRIPVLPKEDLYCKKTGRVCRGQFHPYLSIIYLDKSVGRDPFTLLHELGHYELCKRKKFDHSEDDADRIAYSFLLGLVTKKELRGLMGRHRIVTWRRR